MSFVLPVGAKAPDFSLPGHDDAQYSFYGPHSVQGDKGTLVFFTCNHCPYVVGSEARMKALCTTTQKAGIRWVAVHSNETEGHADDAFPKVKERMQQMGFDWISLHDANQLVARSFGAERTPHYFLFDAAGSLVYSGRMDNSPRDASKAETHELADAMEQLLSGQTVTVAPTAAIGCNVKWWGKERHWMPGDACDLDFLFTRPGVTAK